MNRFFSVATKITALAIAFVLTACGSEENFETRIITAVESNDLRGAVESVTYDDSKLVFNPQGWLVERYQGNLSVNDPSLRIVLRLVYAEDGERCIERLEYLYEINGHADSVSKEFQATPLERTKVRELPNTKYKYNQDGYATREESIFLSRVGEHRKIIKTFEYNDKNQVVERQTQSFIASEKSKEGIEDIESLDAIDKDAIKFIPASTLETIYEYNPQGDCVSEVVFVDKEERNRIEYQYEYDTKDNWIKMTIVSNTTRSIARSITYFQ